MSENPFLPPASESQPSRRAVAGVSILVVIALAAVAGFSFTLSFPAPVFIAPAIAVIVMSLRRPHMLQGVRLAGAALLLSVAGYIAFATTCCCANFAIIDNLGHNYSPPPLAGGIVTAVSTLIGCIVVYGLRSIGRKKLPSED